MKNKKGFTLVELLAVIILLGILMAIAVPSYLGISKKIKTDMYTSKIKTIEVAAISWADENKQSCNATAYNNLTLNDLINGKYLRDDEDSNIVNPNTNEPIKKGDKVSKYVLLETACDGKFVTLRDVVFKNPTTENSTNPNTGEQALDNEWFSNPEPNSNLQYGPNASYDIPVSDKVKNVEVPDDCEDFYVSGNKLYGSLIDTHPEGCTVTFEMEDGSKKDITMYNYIKDFTCEITRRDRSSWYELYDYEISYTSSYINFNAFQPEVKIYEDIEGNHDITQYYKIGKFMGTGPRNSGSVTLRDITPDGQDSTSPQPSRIEINMSIDFYVTKVLYNNRWMDYSEYARLSGR